MTPTSGLIWFSFHFSYTPTRYPIVSLYLVCFLLSFSYHPSSFLPLLSIFVANFFSRIPFPLSKSPCTPLYLHSFWHSSSITPSPFCILPQPFSYLLSSASLFLIPFCFPLILFPPPFISFCNCIAFCDASNMYLHLSRCTAPLHLPIRCYM